MVKIFHKSSIAMAALAPIAFIIPSQFVMPVDIVLGLLFPLHSHVALNYVVADYVPKASRSLARGLVLVASIFAAAGLLKLNVQGPGMTETVKSLWRKPKAAEKK